jgi:serine protease inhibitor
MHAQTANHLVITSLILTFALGGCTLFGSSDDGTEPEVYTGLSGADPALAKVAPDSSVIDATNSFGFSMLKKLVAATPTKNVFISPTSIGMALGMTYNGANGETASEMADVLGITGMEPARYNQAMKVLLSNLTYGDEKVLLEIANSVWARQGVPFEKDFLSRVEHYFAAICTELDFGDPASVDVINAWVNEKTHEKIPTILSEIDPMAAMYLINAVYFNGSWHEKFDPDDTEDRPFTLPGGEIATVPTMYRHGETDRNGNHTYFTTFDGPEFKAVTLDYGDSGRFVMDLVLPDEGITLADFIAGMTPAKWDEWVSMSYEREGYLYLPRLEMEYEADLIPSLKELGVTEAFSESHADFSKMLEDGGLYISLVKHKTFLKVNEEGTEAAAVTAVMVSFVSSYRFVLRLDRPFLMAIRDTHTGTILFMGAICDPR